MSKEHKIKELEDFIISSISNEDNQHININVAKRIVSEIYEEVESRTCSSCKYSEYHEHQDILECEKLYESQQCYGCNTPIQMFEVTNDFGCNKWEKK